MFMAGGIRKDGEVRGSDTVLLYSYSFMSIPIGFSYKVMRAARRLLRSWTDLPKICLEVGADYWRSGYKAIIWGGARCFKYILT
jgi:hypothetical protein